jgi:hypothetical protein
MDGRMVGVQDGKIVVVAAGWVEEVLVAASMQ